MDWTVGALFIGILIGMLLVAIPMDFVDEHGTIFSGQRFVRVDAEEEDRWLDGCYCCSSDELVGCPKEMLRCSAVRKIEVCLEES